MKKIIDESMTFMGEAYGYEIVSATMPSIQKEPFKTENTEEIKLLANGKERDSKEKLVELKKKLKKDYSN